MKNYTLAKMHIVIKQQIFGFSVLFLTSFMCSKLFASEAQVRTQSVEAVAAFHYFKHTPEAIAEITSVMERGEAQPEIVDMQTYFRACFEPVDAEKAKRALSVITGHIPVGQSSVIDFQSIKDLQVLSGAANAFKLNRTFTMIGKMLFALGLINPVANLEELRLRQSFIRELCTALNTPINGGNTWLIRFSGILAELQAFENAILVFKASEFYSLRKIINEKGEIKVNRWPGLSQALSRSNIVLNVRDFPNRMEQSCTGLFREILRRLSESSVGEVFADEPGGIAAVKDCFYLLLGGLQGARRLSAAALPFISSAAQRNYFMANEAAERVASAINGPDFDELEITRTAHKLLCHLSRFVRIVRNFNQCLTEFQSVFPAERPINVCMPSFRFLNLNDEALAVALRLLDAPVFRSEHVPFWHGQIFACFREVSKIIDRFQLALLAIGEFDCYVSIARLLNESSEEKPFCLPTFVSPQSNMPHIKLRDFWCPTLMAKPMVVKNSISLGIHDLEHENSLAHCLIINGPNGGGKSFYLQSIILVLLFGQTYGVSCCSNGMFTPFTYIGSYCNVTDNRSEDRSLHQASTARLGRLIDASKQALGFSFVILDEPLVGTREDYATALTCVYLDELASLNKALCLTSTHLRVPHILYQEQPGRYAFLKASDGKKYPGIPRYKMTPGIEYSCNAFEEAVGLDAALIQKAEKFYSQHFKAL